MNRTVEEGLIYISAAVRVIPEGFRPAVIPVTFLEKKVLVMEVVTTSEVLRLATTSASFLTHLPHLRIYNGRRLQRLTCI